MQKLLRVTDNWLASKEIQMLPKVTTGGALYQKMFLKTSQISQENTSVGFSF